MKKILVTVVLGFAVVAAGQDAAQPAQPAAAAPQSQAPVIKDPAEYNAYVGAVQQADAAAKISGLEAFVTQYPNSVMKVQALELLMGTYQQSGNAAKTMDAATRLVAADPNNVRALTLLAYFDRVKAQGGDPNAKQELADAKKFGQQGLDALPKFNKPDGTSDADFQKMKDQMTGIFDAAVGVAALQDKDYPTATKDLRVAADGNPLDFSVIYPLALAYLQSTPPDSLNGIWYAARAAAVAPPAAQAQIEKYAKGQYRNYHGGEDGWSDVLASAKASPTQPANFTIKPAPSPADQAADLVKTKTPDKMDFAEWELVLTQGKQEDADTVFNAIKGKSVQLGGGLVISTSATKLTLAASLDDIGTKKADVELTMNGTMPAKMIPKEGATVDFGGTPVSYTKDPFVISMDNGVLLTKAAPATKKPPVHHAAP
ncbi:MAG TPA: hypothetical protein VKJ01_03335, partial [Candidatus Solibacter sp.]|nr:hypothetical protein [Candidatus Solibacter sp.]